MTDLKRVHKDLYTATAAPKIVDAPPLPFLMVDGVGDPDGEAWAAAVGALYKAAYAVRAARKRAGIVAPVMPLQGLWSAEGEFGADGAFTPTADRSAWRWTMMILQPPEATADMIPDGGEHRIRLETRHEGRCAQVLHTGPFAEEPATLKGLYAFIEGEGRAITGPHHEIYLSDARRTAPEKLRTILRYPVSG